MPKLTIDGHEIEVAKGTRVIDAAKLLGIDIPHFCYHPALPVVANCRMCYVELGDGRMGPSCNIEATDGLVVYTNSLKAELTRKSVLEFILLNHPVDCPVCDQAGECKLQNYYMTAGLYHSKITEHKILKKRKVVHLGKNVVLDEERCVLCTRCVRFCNEITKTSEIGQFSRGSYSTVGIFDGKPLANNYSGNVVDICPVGALTDADFRFKMRVWYLKSMPSVCTLCSNGCNINVEHAHVEHTLKEGHEQRVYRIKPRENMDVNEFWICDEGRYGYKFIDEGRIKQSSMKDKGIVENSEALRFAAEKLNNIIHANGADSAGVLLSCKRTNEELFLAWKLFVKTLGIKNIAFYFPWQKGKSDELLIKADKNPNTKGAEFILASDEGLKGRSFTVDEVLSKSNLKALYCIGEDTLSGLDEEKVKKLSKSLDLLVVHATNEHPFLQYAHVILPSCTFAEKEGTFTNGGGRVQRISRALLPSGHSLSDLDFLLTLSRFLMNEIKLFSPEDVFDELARTVDEFKDLSYEKIGEKGCSAGQPSQKTEAVKAGS